MKISGINVLIEEYSHIEIDVYSSTIRVDFALFSCKENSIQCIKSLILCVNNK
jgi:hypothetical protein